MLLKLEQLRYMLSKLGLKESADNVLDLIKFADDIEYIMQNEYSRAIAVKHYSDQTYIYKNESAMGCLEFNGLGEALLAYNDREYVNEGQVLRIPILQTLIDRYNEQYNIVKPSCFVSREYTGYIDNVVNQTQCPRDQNRDISREDLPGVISCITNSIGLSSHTDLFSRLVWRESRTEGQSAESHVGAVGYAQLIDAHEEVLRLADIGISDQTYAFDVQGSAFDNLMFGALYLKHLLQKYDHNKYLALAAYNWGKGKVDTAVREHPPDLEDAYGDFSDWFNEERPDFIPEETHGYVREILQIQ